MERFHEPRFEAKHACKLTLLHFVSEFE